MERFVTGIQPSGAIHLGNYLGALKPAIALQDEGQGLYFIADYHALTTVTSGTMLRSHVFNTAVTYLACGLDPSKTILFRQSDIPEVTELSWILSNVTPISFLNRMHGYKDKIAKGFAVNHGLYSYPLLMTADILLYGADKVPVGYDQKQHLEYARDIAGKFNQAYGKILKLPEAVITSPLLVPGLDGEKMSKSYGNTIDLFISLEKLKSLIKSIPTDSTPLESPKPIEGSVLASIMRALVPAEQYTAFESKFTVGGTGYGTLKNELLEAIKQIVEPLQPAYRYYQNNPSLVEDILQDGALRARAIASPILSQVREAVGLNPRSL